jgi:hypothetical protein
MATNISVLTSASAQQLKRLLELFPVTNLRSYWSSLSGTKEQISMAVAGTRNINLILNFIDENVSSCKQHVFILSHNGNALTSNNFKIPGATVVKTTNSENEKRIIFILEVNYEVVVKEPLGVETISFFVPVRLTITAENVVVSFVILEKDFGSYFTGGYHTAKRQGLNEKQIADLLCIGLQDELELEHTDIHKGIKELWESGRIDVSRLKFKKGISTTTEDIDEGKGIKEFVPEIYEKAKDAPILTQLVHIKDFGDDFSIQHFTCSPSDGFLAFTTYSERAGDTDYVVQEIIKHN